MKTQDRVPIEPFRRWVQDQIDEEENREMSAVDEVRVAIEEQISAVRLEIGRLEAARRALRGEDSLVRSVGATRARVVRRGAKARTSARGKRVRRGERQAEVATLVEMKPGIATPSLAEHLGIADTQAYKITARLAATGVIRGDNKGWYPREGE